MVFSKNLRSLKFMQKKVKEEESVEENKEKKERSFIYEDGFKNKKINGRMKYIKEDENMKLD